MSDERGRGLKGVIVLHASVVIGFGLLALLGDVILKGQSVGPYSVPTSVNFRGLLGVVGLGYLMALSVSAYATAKTEFPEEWNKYKYDRLIGRAHTMAGGAIIGLVFFLLQSGGG